MSKIDGKGMQFSITLSNFVTEEISKRGGN